MLETNVIIYSKLFLIAKITFTFPMLATAEVCECRQSGTQSSQYSIYAVFNIEFIQLLLLYCLWWQWHSPGNQGCEVADNVY